METPYRRRETLVPPSHRGGNPRRDPARAGGYRPPDALCRVGRFRLSAELLEPAGRQRQDRAQVHPLAALPRAARGWADPDRAARRRDAELPAVRRDRAALSRAAPRDPQRGRRAAASRRTGGAPGEAQAKAQARGVQARNGPKREEPEVSAVLSADGSMGYWPRREGLPGGDRSRT